jgi:mono/diheme cytochrome c family protein
MIKIEFPFNHDSEGLNMKTKAWTLALLTVLLMILLAACGGGEKQQPETGGETTPPAQQEEQTGEQPQEEGDFSEAQAIFKNQCVSCHGADLQGTMPNTNLTQVGSRLSQEEIAQVITNGRNIMPSFEGKLSEEEIDMLAAWLATKK